MRASSRPTANLPSDTGAEADKTPGVTGPAVPPAAIWAGRVFAVIAFVEAATWTGLLIGMYLKYIPATTEAGVQLFGSLHGYTFIVYVIVTITASVMLHWRWGTILLALLAAIPPLATIPLEIWMRRTGRLTPQPRHDPGLTTDLTPQGDAFS